MRAARRSFNKAIVRSAAARKASSLPHSSLLRRANKIQRDLWENGALSIETGLVHRRVALGEHVRLDGGLERGLGVSSAGHRVWPCQAGSCSVR